MQTRRDLGPLCGDVVILVWVGQGVIEHRHLAGGYNQLVAPVIDRPPLVEPAHQHLDLRYLVRAPAEAVLSPQVEELHDLRWATWDELDALGPDPGLQRALGKARALV